MNDIGNSRETVDCPFCHDDRTRLWGRENGFDAVKCLQCGLVYVNPRPTLSDISENNKIGEHRTETGALDIRFSRSTRKVRHYETTIRQLFRRELDGGALNSWLDIGAGYGELVEALQRVLPKGSIIEGIEPMTSKAKQAQDLGLPVQSRSLDDVSRKFRVVSLINVLSHLPDVPGFLETIASKLEEGGTLLLETGNGGDLASSEDYPDVLFLPDHLVFAGIDHVRGFLERSGFTDVETHSTRRDTALWTLKNIAKRALGRNVKITMPYSSAFRTVFFKATLRNQGQDRT